jgi:hypothetical protein
MLGVDNPSSLILRDRKVFSPKGKSVTLAEIALDTCTGTVNIKLSLQLHLQAL